MAANNLEDALKTAELTPEELAEIIEVDPKSVHRWLQCKANPYPRHRRKIARALNKPEHELWPETVPPPPADTETAADIPPTTGVDHHHPPAASPQHNQQAAVNEVTGSWAAIGDPTAPYPVQLFTAATDRIDLLDGPGDSLLTPGITNTLKDRAEHGCHVRVLTARPPRQLQPLIDHPHIELRLAAATQGIVVIRADHTMLLPIPLADPGYPAVLQLQRQTNNGIFDRLTSHFQTLWDPATPITNPEQLINIPVRPQPDQPPATQTLQRRWPSQPS